MTPEVATEFLFLDQEQSFDCEKKIKCWEIQYI